MRLDMFGSTEIISDTKLTEIRVIPKPAKRIDSIDPKLMFTYFSSFSNPMRAYLRCLEHEMCVAVDIVSAILKIFKYLVDLCWGSYLLLHKLSAT